MSVFAPNYIIRTFMVPIQLSLFHHQLSLIHVEQMNEPFSFLIVPDKKKKKKGLRKLAFNNNNNHDIKKKKKPFQLKTREGRRCCHDDGRDESLPPCRAQRTQFTEGKKAG